jgi:hypothetical protein
MSNNFSIPHRIIDRLLPSNSNATPADWTGLVRRADQIWMDRGRNSCTKDNGQSDEYEGTWLNKWVGQQGFAQRMHDSESALVPLFHDLTRPLDSVDIAKSQYGFDPVRYQDISGEHEGVDLGALAKRIAATALESLDGDPNLVTFEALADAYQAHTPKELTAINVILNRYFQRNVTFTAFDDPRTQVTASFEAKETPTEICRESSTKATYKVNRELLKLNVKAPADSKVSVVPLDRCGKWADSAMEAEVGANGEVSFDVSKLAKTTVKLAVYVVHDEDGRGPKMPQVKSRAAIPMPWGTFNWTVDNTDRQARLKAGRP